MTEDEQSRVAERLFMKMVADRLGGKRLSAVDLARYEDLTGIEPRWTSADVDEALDALRKVGA